MPLEHRKTPAWVDYRAAYTSNPPVVSKLGRQMQWAYAHMTHWRFASNLFTYSAPAAPTKAGGGANNNPETGEFYPILPGAPKADSGDRNLGIAWLGWPVSADAGVAPQIDYIDPDSTTQTVWSRPNAVTGDFYVAASAGDKLDPNATQARTYDDSGSRLIWTPDAGGAFRKATIDYQAVQFAALSLWEMPDATLTQALVEVNAAMFAPGRQIRGYDGATLADLGGLAEKIGDGSLTMESIEAATRRMLLQFFHGGGIRTSSTSYVDMFNGFTFRVRPRKLLMKDSTVLACRPAVVVTTNTAHSGASVKFTNNTNSATSTWTNDATARTAYLVEMDTLNVTDGVLGLYPNHFRDNYITIEAKAASGGSIDVHSAILYEGAPW